MKFSSGINRRTFVKSQAAVLVTGVPVLLSGQSLNSKIRVGIIGVGGRGTALLRRILKSPGVEVAAPQLNIGNAQAIVGSLNQEIELVGTDSDYLHLFYDDGTEAPGFPFQVGDKIQSAPAILELDGQFGILKSIKRYEV